jgi:hypothetical protein
LRETFCEKDVNNLRIKIPAFHKPAYYVAFTASEKSGAINLRLHLSWALTIAGYGLVSQLSTVEKGWLPNT